jgi:hypothetical protein
MPDRLLTAQSSFAGCLFQSALYGTCLSLFGMPVDALLLGAIAAGIAHGLREQTTRRKGWSRIGIGTLLAGSGAPVVAAVALLVVDFGEAATTVRPVAQALSAIVIGASWPNLTGVLLTGLSDLIAKFTGGRK